MWLLLQERMRSVRILRRWAFVLAAGAALSPEIALAQNKPPGPSDPYTEADAPPPDAYDEAEAVDAKATYEEGLELAKKKQWEGAYTKFRAAFRVVKRSETASALGRVEMRLGKYRDAVKHLTLALEGEGLSPRAQADLEELIAKAKAATGTLHIQATSTSPARVLLDGEEVGATPYSADEMADPGDHEVELQHEKKRQKVSAAVHTGETVEVTVHLEIAEPPPPLPPPVVVLPPPPPPSTSKLPFAVGLTLLTAGMAAAGAALASQDAEEKKIGSIVCFGAAIASGGAAGALWYFTVRENEERNAPPSSTKPVISAGLFPSVGPRSGGFVLQGVF